jgi:geranylgeranyl pyrophosphate synthase
MQESQLFKTLFNPYIALVDEEVRTLIKSKGDLGMYEMMEYSFGFDNNNASGGKHFRSGLCLYLADALKTSTSLLEIATAIEIFHNFTLIHDDIEDHDILRRGKATVWKKYGLEQGINMGDALLIMSYAEMNKFFLKSPNLECSDFLTENFLLVSEGQHLDLKLAQHGLSDEEVSVDTYLEMIRKKSAILISTSASVVAYVGKTDDTLKETLSDYGLNLGLGYQIKDDLVSIWGYKENSGKTESQDLVEKKKTLPIILLFSKATTEEQTKLNLIYNREAKLENSSIKYIHELLAKYNILDDVKVYVKKYHQKSDEKVELIPISRKAKADLILLNKNLLGLEEVKK